MRIAAYLVLAASLLVGGVATAQTMPTTPRPSGECNSSDSCYQIYQQAKLRAQQFGNAISTNVGVGLGDSHEQAFAIAMRDAYADEYVYENVYGQYMTVPGYSPDWADAESSAFMRANMTVERQFRNFTSLPVYDAMAEAPYTWQSGADAGGGGVQPGDGSSAGGLFKPIIDAGNDKETKSAVLGVALILAGIATSVFIVSKMLSMFRGGREADAEYDRQQKNRLKVRRVSRTRSSGSRSR